MSVTVKPLGAHIGGEIVGFDISKPIDQATATELRRALTRYGVVVIRDQEIDDEAQIAFSRCFGPLEVFVKAENRDRLHPEIMEIIDVGDTTKWLSTALLWHTDGSYKQVPSYVTTLRAIEICPEGGDTCFANTAAGYAALSEERKRAIDGLQVVHDLAHSRHLVPNLPPFTPEERAKVPPVVHPLVRRHSETGDKVLYLGCHARARLSAWKRKQGRRCSANCSIGRPSRNSFTSTNGVLAIS
ncbi:MAG: TauD/TfdA family dioxygenase [Alphaproteobacteria bacterium]|nr:TauD/TfdA family dioxygenase [Alphaproteobacteria bacterium]